MKTKYSRRSVIAGGALALIGTTLTGRTKAKTPDSVKTIDAGPKSAEDSAIKTRKASCMCGKLTLTYKGPDPERRSLCQCNNCQMRTGSVFSVQARMLRANSKIEGKSKAWTFPDKAKPVTYQSCDSGGATYHFCPECGCTVYWDMAFAPEYFGVAVGGFTDPTFPPPVVSGFEHYGHPWAMNAAAVPMVHADCGEIGKPCPSKS